MLLWVRGVQVLIAFEGDGGVETKAEAEAEAEGNSDARAPLQSSDRAAKQKLRGESGNRTPDHFHPKEVSYH